MNFAQRSKAASRRVAVQAMQLSCLLGAGLTSCAESPGERPDVLLISLDSVRADDLTFMDAERSPNLTELARRGTIFRRAVAGSSWTLPTHVQMFTGQPPSLHGVQADHHRIDPLTKTLSESLRDAGYAGFGFWSGWYLSGGYGYDRGFARYERAMNLDEGADAEFVEALRGAPDAAKAAVVGRERKSHQDITSELVANRASAAIRELDADTPLFLFAHFFDPHYDYIPPEPFNTLVDPDYDGPMDGREFWSDRRIFDPEKRPPRQISDRDLEHVRALYRGEIRWTDQAVGQILDELERAGRLDNTLIIVTADHGEEFFEHGNRGHRQSLYEEVLRVPLLVVPPKRMVRERASADTLASLSDIMPTILEYVGAPLPQTVDGRSLKPVVEGGALRQRALLSSLAMSRRVSETETVHYVMESLTREADKLTRLVRIDPDGTFHIDRIAWSDLKADPGEQNARRSPAHPDVRAAWRALEAETERLRQRHAQLPKSPRVERSTDIRATFANDLAELGYADGADESEQSAGREWTLAPLPPVALPAAKSQ